MRCAIRELVSFIRPVCAGFTACLIITHSDEVWQGGAESQGATRTGVALSMYFSRAAQITFRVLLDKILLIKGLFTERHEVSSTAASGGCSNSGDNIKNCLAGCRLVAPLADLRYLVCRHHSLSLSLSLSLQISLPEGVAVKVFCIEICSINCV